MKVGRITSKESLFDMPLLRWRVLRLFGIKRRLPRRVGRTYVTPHGLRVLMA